MEILIAKNDRGIRVVHTIKTMIVICEAANNDNIDIKEVVNVRVNNAYMHAGSVVIIALEYANFDGISSDEYLKVAVSDSRAVRVFDTQFPLEIL